MPRTKSAKKHERQTKARTAANRAAAEPLRSAIKAARAAGTPKQQAAALKRGRAAARPGRPEGDRPPEHGGTDSRAGWQEPPKAKAGGRSRNSTEGPARRSPFPFLRACIHGAAATAAANSAPQRSQYHSVGRFIAPHSVHFRVLAAVRASRRPIPRPSPAPRHRAAAPGFEGHRLEERHLVDRSRGRRSGAGGAGTEASGRRAVRDPGDGGSMPGLGVNRGASTGTCRAGAPPGRLRPRGLVDGEHRPPGPWRATSGSLLPPR